MERLLSDNEAAEVLGTSVQFPRQLIAQRRIRFIRVGRLVRIPKSAVHEYHEGASVRVTRVLVPTNRDRTPKCRRGKRGLAASVTGRETGQWTGC